MQYRGLWGFIVLIADVWAIVNIFQSSATTGNKVVWTVVVILLPVLGFILWYFLGPKTGKAVGAPRSSAASFRVEQHRRLVGAVAQRGVDRGKHALASRQVGGRRIERRASVGPRCRDETPSCRALFGDYPRGPNSSELGFGVSTLRSNSRRSFVNADSCRLQRSIAATACGPLDRANALTSCRAPLRTRSRRSSHSIHDSEFCMPLSSTASGWSDSAVCRYELLFGSQSTAVGSPSPVRQRPIGALRGVRSGIMAATESQCL